MPLWGAVEAGGTKFVCAVGEGPDQWREEVRFPTTTPAETLARVVDFLRGHHRREGLAGVGIGSFGPVDPDPASPAFGQITSTPKAGWAHTDIVGPVHRGLGVPVGFDTDVNAAALGEHRWGAAQGLDTFIYLTVGTGIGGGGMAGGRLLHGLLHPEMGHVRIPHDRQADPYPGWCPYHGNCLEGLANGPALEARWGQRAEDLPPDHPGWELEAHYLALGVVNFVCTLSPQRVVMGGGVMAQPHLLPRVRARVQDLLQGYLQTPHILRHIDDYLVLPGLGNRAGISGALALAMAAAR
ncbi:MAG: ROK family protein [Candidatus Latescibacterota bacterium]